MHLTVIAKQPRPGFVKTRLCPPCTHEQAADVAAAALLDTLDAVDEVAASAARHGVELDRVLLFDGDPDRWLRSGYRCVQQHGDDLAARLANGFDALGPGLIVGMETPHAVAALACGVDAIRSGADALGLAVDGGYWAIGLHRVDAEVFANVPMSTSVTGLAQLRQLHRLGRSVRLLPCAHDLDTVDDLRIAARREPAPLPSQDRLGVVARNVLNTVEDS